jgi:hypothetical protein
MRSKFWDKKCFLANKERLYIILHGFDFCTYKNQTDSFCRDCSRRFTVKDGFEYYKQSIEDLRHVDCFNLSKQLPEVIKEDFGVDVTEKEVDDFRKKNLGDCFKNPEEIAKELNRVYPLDLAKQVVEYVWENFGINITEQEVYDWAKRYKRR